MNPVNAGQAESPRPMAAMTLRGNEISLNFKRVASSGKTIYILTDRRN